MNHLSIVLFVTLAILKFDVSQGQTCQSDVQCASTHCCVRHNLDICLPRYQFSTWCYSPRSCVTNLDCRYGECCRLSAHGDGHCEYKPRDTTGSSMHCQPHGPTTCRDESDCRQHECCRMTSSGQGQCVHNSHEGEACSTVSSTGIVDMCPCELGLDCKAKSGSATPNRGVCQSHASGCTSHTECKQQRPGTCCKSVGGSQRMCVTAVDAYGKC